MNISHEMSDEVFFAMLERQQRERCHGLPCRHAKNFDKRGWMTFPAVSPHQNLCE
jgi:hypothetical protein